MLCQPGQAISRGKLSEQVLPTEFSTGVALQLLNNRPDVHAAEMKLAACYHNVQTARSRFYPGINISGNGVFTNSVTGMGVSNPGMWIFQAVGTLTQPIFQNGKLVAGLKATKAQQENANRWINEWHFSDEMLREAYERCVNKKNSFNITYTNGILKNWNKRKKSKSRFSI